MIETGQPRSTGFTIERSDGLLTADVGPVFINCWTRPPTVERLNQLIGIQERLVKRCPRFSVVTLVDPGVGRDMDGAARKRAGEVGNMFASVAACRIFLVLAKGFYAATVRTVISGVMLLTRTPGEYHVVTELEEALGKLESGMKNAGLPVDRALVRDAIQQILEARGAAA